MKFCINSLLFSISMGLDFVEEELLGVSTNHAKRVACICNLMGKSLGLNNDELTDLVGVALLHDNALTEYLQSEYSKSQRDKMPADAYLMHCEMGQRNIEVFPFKTDVSKAILYHHENADGSGPFGIKGSDIPLYARLIHLADSLDTKFNLCEINALKYQKIIDYLNRNKDVLYCKEEVEAFTYGLKYDVVEGLNNKSINNLLYSSVPYLVEEYSPQMLEDIASLIARIIDYKSTFTNEHSMELAKKAKIMGEYYHYDTETCSKLYLAGALHDIGKLAIDVNILEKEGKLTAEEFEIMKKHALITYELLNSVEGFADITNWASHHHEKLDGSGYPFMINGDNLSFNERLLACLDIYQALSEKRPYKNTLSHREIMDILNKLVANNSIDGTIVADIDKRFGNI